MYVDCVQAQFVSKKENKIIQTNFPCSKIIGIIRNKENNWLIVTEIGAFEIKNNFQTNTIYINSNTEDVLIDNFKQILPEAKDTEKNGHLLFN